MNRVPHHNFTHIRKKLLPVLLIVASLLFLLAGCQPSSTANPTTDPTTPPPTEPDITFATAPGAVTVYIYDLSYHSGALDYPYELKTGELPPPE